MEISLNLRPSILPAGTLFIDEEIKPFNNISQSAGNCIDKSVVWMASKTHHNCLQNV